MELVRRYGRILRLAGPHAATWLVALAAITLALVAPPVVSAPFVIVGIVALWWLHLSGRLGAEPAARSALIVALAAIHWRPDHPDWLVLVATVLLIGAVLAEAPLARFVSPALRAYRLAGLRPAIATRFPEAGFQATCFAMTVLAVHAVGWVNSAAALALIVASLGLGAVLTLRQLVAVRRHEPERAIRTALADYDPRYALYYAGPNQGAYQLTMWFAHLARTGERGILVIRDLGFLETALAISELPVIWAGAVEPLEYVMGPGLHTVFYVNNDPRNGDGVRFAGPRHVFLGHGDSEKPSSYSAASGMYDQLFVAGQAGADRYARHGVLIPESKFVHVGRPQLAGLIERSQAPATTARPTVLYAPTWRGGLGDMLLGSLRDGERIVSALISAGARVIFRPHPLSYRDAESRVLIGRVDSILASAGHDHVRSDQADEMTIFACMNAADAMVADISSVLSDFLYADKPFAIAVDRANAAIIEQTPLARAGHLLWLDSDPNPVLTSLLGTDQFASARAQVRSYYLGEWPDSAYADAFVSAAVSAMSPKH